MTQFKKRRRAVIEANRHRGELPPSDLEAQLNALPRNGPTQCRAVKSGGSKPGSGRRIGADMVKLREALPKTLRSLIDNRTVTEPMAGAAAKFLLDWRAGYLTGGTVNYGERVQGGGAWSDGGIVAGTDARARVAEAMTAMRPLPSAAVKAVLIDGVSLGEAGADAPYSADKTRRAFALGQLIAGLDELVRFYA
ncbi:hypothetical protein [Litorimonas sp. WD9-15]|uniref:hypothetical protein n=1 Tax=Litorimonas sp. WD9-15 TaxID=3418716 RepID=UPI003CFC31FA